MIVSSFFVLHFVAISMRADRRDLSFKKKKKNHDSRKVKSIIYINHIVFKKGKLPPENIVNAHIYYEFYVKNFITSTRL